MKKAISKGINRIKITGFKSIKNCDLKLGYVNVLIGSNGSGKSNFIEAFNMLQAILSKNLAIYSGQSGIDTLFFKTRKITDEMSMEIFAENYSYGLNLIPTDDNQLMFKDEFLCVENSKYQIKAGHRESALKGFDNIKAKELKEFLSANCWQTYHFHDTSRYAKVKSEHNISDNRSLHANAGNLAAFLLRLKNHFKANYDEIVETIRLIAPYFADFSLEPEDVDNEKIILRWQQKGCSSIFNASQFSDGTLRFICLATLLLMPEKLKPQTIIIDEPELGLHPYAITIFSELVRQASIKNQIIVSTQSVDLLNEFEVKEIIVAERKNESSHFIRPDPKSLSVWLEEDYSTGELWHKNILGGRVA